MPYPYDEKTALILAVLSHLTTDYHPDGAYADADSEVAGRRLEEAADQFATAVRAYRDRKATEALRDVVPSAAQTWWRYSQPQPILDAAWELYHRLDIHPPPDGAPGLASLDKNGVAFRDVSRLFDIAITAYRQRLTAHQDAIITRRLRALHDTAHSPTTRDIAKRAGVSHTTVADALAGRRVPEWRTLARIVQALGEDPDAFRARTEAPE